MIRVSRGKIPINSNKVANNRHFPQQGKVPPMPTLKTQFITTNCKNCGAIIGKDGVCKYCGSFYGEYAQKETETWGDFVVDLEDDVSCSKTVLDLVQDFEKLGGNSYANKLITKAKSMSRMFTSPIGNKHNEFVFYILRDQLFELCKKSIKQKYITEDDLEQGLKMYDELISNDRLSCGSMLYKLVEKARKLPLQDCGC